MCITYFVVQDADELSTSVQPAGQSAHEQMVQLLHRQRAQENPQGSPFHGEWVHSEL